MVLKGDVFFSVFFFDIFVKIFWTISTDIYNSDSKYIKIMEGAFLCAETALRERVEYKQGLKECEGFREVQKAFQAEQMA